MKKRIYTDEEFIEAVKTSFSIRDTIKKLGLIPCGGNYSTFKRTVKRLNLDTSHFTGMLWSKGRKLGDKRILQDYLNNKFPITSHRLRLRLIKDGVKEPKCEKCNLSEWLGKSLSLELDHIDGNHSNNRLENLRILCPNCHSLTSTHRGKNKKKK